MAIEIKIINKSDNPLPGYATPGSSGLDIRSHLTDPVILNSLDRVLIPTGMFLEIPEGYEAQVRPRSGLAFRHGITCLNSPGTIDSDYRGEIGVILVNLSPEKQTIQPGERIAQLVFQKVERVNWELAEQIVETKRGEGGFGHTGKN